jgi:hypothetical protein
MRVRHGIWLLPLLLVAAGLVTMLAVTGGAAWPFALGWVVAAGAIAVTEALTPTRRIRVLLAVLIVLALPVLVWEGGFFVWPAAVALLVAAVVAPPPRIRRRCSGDARLMAPSAP